MSFILPAKNLLKVSKVVRKIKEFCFLDTAKHCINIYTAYLCIFLLVHLDPPRLKTAGPGELCADPLVPLSSVPHGVLWL